MVAPYSLEIIRSVNTLVLTQALKFSCTIVDNITVILINAKLNEKYLFNAYKLLCNHKWFICS